MNKILYFCLLTVKYDLTLSVYKPCAHSPTGNGTHLRIPVRTQHLSRIGTG